MRRWISIDPVPGIEKLLLQWAANQPVACILQSNFDGTVRNDPYSAFDWCAAIGAESELQETDNAFGRLKKFHEEKKDWLFGYLTYDLKNQVENLHSKNFDGLDFPALHFFQPQDLFIKDKNGMRFGTTHNADPKKRWDEILKELIGVTSYHDENGFDTKVQMRVTKDSYTKNVQKILQHIQRGNIYEMNYCVEFFSEGNSSRPEDLFEKLNALSPMPFGCFYKKENHSLLCASPERFIAKRGNKIISQPIKGTIRRGVTAEEDQLLIHKLRNDEKEKSENVMIVDLVRNDLSRTAKKGSVRVEELFGIYSFRQLHQMISTVVSELKEDVHWTEVLRTTFPMGSMTGAPKIKAMELIEQYEDTKRGLYSGTIGYVTTEGDFDFNVVIRSILINRLNQYLSFMVGSAITINSNPEREYEECLLKASAIMQVLKNELPQDA